MKKLFASIAIAVAVCATSGGEEQRQRLRFVRICTPRTPSPNFEADSSIKVYVTTCTGTDRETGSQS